jgi:hypothetical protein
MSKGSDTAKGAAAMWRAAPGLATAMRVPHCTLCHRIAAPDGYWRTPDTNVCQDVGVTLVNKVCPDCARRAYARGAYRYPTEQAD